MAQHGLGYRPDTFDVRDFRFQTHPARVAALPPAVDGRPFCGPVRDQGGQGSCTGFSLSALREFMLNKAQQAPSTTELSPAFIYYEERRAERSTRDCDAGAYIRDGMDCLLKMGVCLEQDDPYTDTRCRAPRRAAKKAAKAYTIGAYHRITTLDELKTALADGQGAVLGVLVYESFESQVVQDTGHVPTPGPLEALLGGHAIFCCGYQDDANYPGGGFVICQNSWGTQFGDAGFIFLNYQYISDPKLTSDIWTAT